MQTMSKDHRSVLLIHISRVFVPLAAGFSIPPGTAGMRMGTAMRQGTASTDSSSVCTSNQLAQLLDVGCQPSLMPALCQQYPDIVFKLFSQQWSLQARPMTSNRGAGFSSNPKGRFDPFGQASKGVTAGSGSSLLLRKQEASAEEVKTQN